MAPSKPPPPPDAEAEPTVIVRLSRPLYDRLDAIAKAEDRSIRSALDRAVADYLARLPQSMGAR